MIAHVNGVDLYFEKAGEGRPLVLAHGNGEDHTIFLEAAEALKDSFACYLVDSRGHGRSTPAVEYHYRDMARDMVAFMDELSLEDAVFCGFSDGGILGLLAAMESRRISDLIVCGANTAPGGLKLRARLTMRIGYIFKKDPLLALMLKEPDITRGELKTIRARTFVLAGENDLIREEHTRAIAAAVPGAELRILPGEGHGSYIIHSDKIAAVIRELCPAREGDAPRC